jgi:anti-sigma regulatory factor (Ser/Thr protein kinase)
LTTPVQPTQGSYQLTVPSEPDQIATVRLFVGSVARLSGLDDDTIEDAKLAASELATAIVAAGVDPTITVSAVPRRGSLALVITPWREGMGEEEDFGALEIVGALFTSSTTEDSVHIDIEASGEDA